MLLSSFDLVAPPPFTASLICMLCVRGQMTAGRCHTLLSPVTEESGEEGTNSEVSSPPACRSPSPGANADAPLNQVHQRPPALAAPARFYSLQTNSTVLSSTTYCQSLWVINQTLNDHIFKMLHLQRHEWNTGSIIKELQPIIAEADIVVKMTC